MNGIFLMKLMPAEVRKALSVAGAACRRRRTTGRSLKTRKQRPRVCCRLTKAPFHEVHDGYNGVGQYRSLGLREIQIIRVVSVIRAKRGRTGDAGELEGSK
jgi:hypothetical protein